MHSDHGNEARGDAANVLSLVVPAYNEQEVIEEFHRRAVAVIDKLGMPAEILYVNDGSSDDTLEQMLRLGADDERVSVVDLSRNFGKEIAITAGLDHAVGDAVVVIDADLQDPPELIPELVAEWRNGYEVVYARRMSRDGESWTKKVTAFLFYRTIQRMSSRVKIPADTGDYRLLSRRAVDALKQFRERNRFMKGLFAWIGFAQTAVPYRRDARKGGVSKWNYVKLWNFALEGITSFSSMPLKASTYVGGLAAMGAFGFGTYVIVKTLAFGEPVAGYPSLIAVITFIGGVQLVAIGIMGEYVARMFEETKGRPLYLINEYVPARALTPRGLPEGRAAGESG